MRSDLDEQDLYPPDAADTDLTPEAKHHRMRAAVGATLLTWGTSLVIQLSLGVDLDTFVLGLGIGALAGWSQLRRYHWFVVGSIAVGLGAAEVVGAVIGGAFGSAVASLLVVAGFAAIYVRYPRRSMWALVPAAVMALVAAGAFGVGLIGLLPAMLGRFLLPLLLVTGGALLLFRHSLPPKAVKVGLAGLAVTFVLVGANSVPDLDSVTPPVEVGAGPPDHDGDQTYALPSLDGKTLVLEGDSGSVTFASAEEGEARIVSDDDGGFEIAEEADRVVARATDDGAPFRDRPDPNLVVYLPEGVDVEAERSSGSIGGVVRGGRGSFVTDSGPIRLTLLEGGAEGFDDDGPYDIRTDTGPIRIDSPVGLVLDVESDDGPIRINDEDVAGDEYRSAEDARGIDVEVDTESGPIRIEASGGDLAPVPASPTVPD